MSKHPSPLGRWPRAHGYAHRPARAPDIVAEDAELPQAVNLGKRGHERLGAPPPGPDAKVADGLPALPLRVDEQHQALCSRLSDLAYLSTRTQHSCASTPCDDALARVAHFNSMWHRPAELPAACLQTWEFI